MSERTTPSVVVFDVNETLSDMTPLQQRFEDVGLPAAETATWFAGLLRDGFALTSTGANPAFADLGAESLRVRLLAAGAGPDTVDGSVEHVMGGFGGLATHPDVVEGVRALRAVGLRLVTLSNGSSSVAEGLLTRAGIIDDFEQLLSVADAPAWKPVSSAYQHALDACRVSGAEAVLVAVHPWDIDGAAKAGLRTGWLNRTGGRYPAYFRAPELVATDLVDLAAQLA